MQPSIPYPIIYQYRCIGCGDCVASCPVDALAAVDGKAQLAHPERCTYCTLCEDICPTDAIALPFLVTFRDESAAAD